MSDCWAVPELVYDYNDDDDEGDCWAVPELVTENAAAGHDRHDLPVLHIHKQH